MTKKERINVALLNASRRKRIASGSGTAVSDVNRLVKQQQDMARMMKKMGKGGMLKQAMKGMFGKGMPDAGELSGKLDPKELQKAAKDLGNMSPNNIPGGLSGIGGGQLPPGLSGFGKKK